jgi:PAS domain S-box-containing protein
MPRANDPPPDRSADPLCQGSADVAAARLALLAEAGRSLASSLDYATTLSNVARLAVPALADWCAVDVVEDDGSLQRRAVVHPDPGKVELAKELFRKHPPDPNVPHGVWQVLHTGRSELHPDITDELLRERVRDPELVRTLRELGLRSAMLVPLSARGRGLGVLTLVAAESGRRYGPEDLALAEELGSRCGLAVDNARLYRAAAAAEQRYRLIADNTRDVVFAYDMRRRLLYVNPAFEALTGYRTAELWQRGEIPYVHPQDRQRRQEVLDADYAGRSSEEVEYRVFTRSGALKWCSASWGPLLDGEGRQVGVQGREHDVTEHKRMEEELRRRADDLAAAGRHKDAFVATLAHELRNPLAPVRNALHILRLRGGDPATLAWAGDVLERQVGHLGRMIDDLLDVSRITRGKVVLKRERVDLARLVRVAAEDQRADLERAGLVLEIDLPPTALWVEGDSMRLAQVLDNLLSNAGKFTPPRGRVTVRLNGPLAGASGWCGPGAGASGWSGGRARIVVRDTGVGIAPDLLPRLFETLTQADTSLERSQGGLGLGLALVKGLVELHGGTVEAHSAGMGQGAEFVVTLPLEQPAPAAKAPAPAAGAAGQRLRILMVEDNRDGAETLQTLLQLAGHEVALAVTGPEGVALAHEFHPDVVLCDIGLPGMDGFDVGRALRRDPVTAASRLIVLSGYGQEEDRRKSHEAGFDLHLTKPVDPSELQRLLRAQPVGAGRKGQGAGNPR